MQLSGRDRQLLALAVVLAVIWLGWVFWVGPRLERAAQAQEQIGRKGKQLEELIELRARWDELVAQRAALEARLSGRGKGFFSIEAALQAAARRAGVDRNVKGTTETPAIQEGRYRRRAAEANLEKLTLDQLISYLYELEDPRAMLQVDRLEVRPRTDNLRYLDVSATVSAVEKLTK